MAVQCGPVEGVAIEQCPNRQVIVHTNQGDVQCATKDVFSAIVDHLTSQHKVKLARGQGCDPGSPVILNSVPNPPTMGTSPTTKRALLLSDTPIQADGCPASKRPKGGTMRKRNSISGAIPRRSLRIVAQEMLLIL
ncbi:hypothetical protein FCM35_KLT20371 [Carex littledalei]|uniref:Uncharacterized protein n=1 Tax=Carex littledalei TaxID=544730 RepID=A0A833VWM6_9POAL|nr:hypothetical protein FCM35_KLT20371 [Carex littledalei]